MTSFQLNNLVDIPTYKYSHTLRYLGITAFNIFILGRDSSAHNNNECLVSFAGHWTMLGIV